MTTNVPTTQTTQRNVKEFSTFIIPFLRISNEVDAASIGFFEKRGFEKLSCRNYGV